MPMLAAFLGGWEIMLWLAVILILFGASRLPGGSLRRLQDGLKQGIDEFTKASDKVNREMKEKLSEFDGPKRDRESFSIALLIAQGFGIGRIPEGDVVFGDSLRVRHGVSPVNAGDPAAAAAAARRLAR